MNNLDNKQKDENDEIRKKELEKERIREMIREGSNEANNIGKEYSKVTLKDITMFILFALVSGAVLYFTSIVVGILLIGILYLISRIFIK